MNGTIVASISQSNLIITRFQVGKKKRLHKFAYTSILSMFAKH